MSDALTLAQKLAWLQLNTLAFSFDANDHRVVYESLDDALAKEDVDADQKSACSRTGQLVVVQCYPDTPVGFYRVIDTDMATAIDRMFTIIRAERDEAGRANGE